jgi:tRNA (guanine37-N1)-methyltransferase
MSKNQDSFSDDIFDFPNYTRPEIFDGIKVPEVLLSGHHSQIKAWRDQQAIKKTKEKRPDLLNNEGSKKKIKPGF